jgi:predicted aspartyl protease
MTKRKILVFVTTASVLSTCLFAAPRVTTLTGTLLEFGYTPVRLKRAQNHVYAACKIKGRSLDFGVDTGAQGTLLSASESELLAGPAKKVEGHASGLLGKMAADLRVGEVNDFEVGSYKAGSQQIGLWDFSRHRPPGIGMRTEGLLGIDFLHRHQAVIDCFQMNLFLKSPNASSTSSALGASLRAGGCTEIPLQAIADGLAVPIHINGNPGYLILDTGSPWTMLRENAIANLKLRRAPVPLSFRGGFGYRRGLTDASGRDTAALGMAYFNTMEIGHFSVPSQGVGVANLPPLKGGGPGTFFGYLGADLLAYYVGVIDCRSLKLFLRLDPVIEAERKKHHS